MTNILIQIKDDSKTNDVIQFLNDIDFLEVKVQSDNKDKAKSNKKQLTNAFGIWKDKTISLSEIREKAWH